MGPPGWKTKFAGVGLGLQKFAAAKKSTYDKRVVQAKQQALNAKKVNKYRKLLKKLGSAENGESSAPVAEEASGATHRIGKKAVRGDVRFEDAPGSAEDTATAMGTGKQLSRKRKQQQQQDDDIESNSDDEEGPSTSAAAHEEAPRHGKRQKGKDGKQGAKLERPKTSLERLAAKVAAEKEEKRKERKKADDEWAKEMAAKAAKQKLRKKAKSNYMKKTKSGQPVMKHRVDKILSQLQGGGT